MNSATRTVANPSKLRPSFLIACVFLAAVLAWSYAAPMSYLVSRWWNDPDYVYGFLVPWFSGYLLWTRRGMLENAVWTGSWWGLVFLGLAAAMRWYAAYYLSQLLPPLSLLPCLAGILLLVGGWKVLQWAWPAIVFLGFMVPLPGILSDQLSFPLQRIGTVVSTYFIQTVGIPAVALGNLIKIPSAELGVADVCSGLRMMMLFFAVCAAVAFCAQRSIVEKVILVASAVPIAILANVARLVVTAILYEVAGPEWGERLFHDLAGWFMMPLAMFMLWLELELMTRIVKKPRSGPLAPHMGLVGSDSR